MKLTLLYAGSPQSATIVNTETGEVLERVRSIAMRTEGQVDILTVELVIDRHVVVNPEVLEAYNRPDSMRPDLP